MLELLKCTKYAFIFLPLWMVSLHFDPIFYKYGGLKWFAQDSAIAVICGVQLVFGLFFISCILILVEIRFGWDVALISTSSKSTEPDSVASWLTGMILALPFLPSEMNEMNPLLILTILFVPGYFLHKINFWFIDRLFIFENEVFFKKEFIEALIVSLFLLIGAASFKGKFELDFDSTVNEYKNSFPATQLRFDRNKNSYRLVGELNMTCGFEMDFEKTLFAFNNCFQKSLEEYDLETKLLTVLQRCSYQFLDFKGESRGASRVRCSELGGKWGFVSDKIN